MTQLNGIQAIHLPSIGKLPLKEGGASFVPSGVSREFQRGQTPQDSGYIERITHAKLEFRINLIEKFDFSMLSKLKEENLTIHLTDGSVYMMPDAWISSPLEVDGQEALVRMAATTSEKIH